MLSIIIVNYKTPEILKLCIRSLNDTVINTPYEIIVVDLETDPETEDMILDRFKNIKFLGVKDNLGYAKSVNLGIKKSSGDYVLILNPDIVTTKGSVDKMLAHMKSQSKIGMMGPRLINFNGSMQYSAFRFYDILLLLLRRTFLGKLKFGKKKIAKFLLKDKNIETINHPQKADWLMGSAMLVSKKALQKVGGMDEMFFMYFEDVDWSRRFWENGFEVIYFPQSIMYHYHRQASKKSGILNTFTNKMTREHLKSAYKYFKKYGLKNTHYV